MDVAQYLYESRFFIFYLYFFLRSSFTQLVSQQRHTSDCRVYVEPFPSTLSLSQFVSSRIIG